MNVRGVQLSGEHVAGADDADVVRLGTEDVPEMLDLVRRTKPGPFRPRTIELGVYLGLRSGGVLVAMIRNRGETPFLHASAADIGAIRLYERLGFRLRRTPDFRAVRVPALDPSQGTPVPIT
ncbi:GNAT family N-acetyltransferase [Nonomuraea sp. NPDC005501]|uniref:GNAT family N-acetyltransferase n=1 Tax=Nonomuraea sp. NPDC005501 TaxID=3156884 RepID=UPI0033A95725